MKYYCKNCGSEFSPKQRDTALVGTYVCPICQTSVMAEIPQFEPVSRWEKRTRREYPDTAPVYGLLSFCGKRSWTCMSYETAVGSTVVPYLAVVVATEAGAPPDGWRPEE